MQKLVRAGFGNNNVDTCARVCHSPTGYGLKSTLGESAGTQNFDSVMKADVIMVIGANPTDGHPVFASQMKRRLREGAKLIVADPRRIDLVRTPHIKADYHLKLRPGTNVALINSLAHVVVTEGLVNEEFVRARCEPEAFEKWRKFVAEERNSPEAMESVTGVPAADVRAAARALRDRRQRRDLLRPRRHRALAGLDDGHGHREPRDGDRRTSAAKASASIRCAARTTCRARATWVRSRTSSPRYRHVSDDATRASFEKAWGVQLQNEPGLRIPNMFEAALDGEFKALYIEGEDIAQSDPNTQHVTAALTAMECIVVQDLFLNETAKFAHVFLPGSSFLEKDGTFTNAERRVSRVRKVMQPRIRWNRAMRTGRSRSCCRTRSAIR